LQFSTLREIRRLRQRLAVISIAIYVLTLILFLVDNPLWTKMRYWNALIGWVTLGISIVYWLVH
jgi:uncharacterized membrane protein